MAMKLILAIVKPFKVAVVVDALEEWESFPGMTVFDVRGFGREKTAPHEHERAEDLRDFTEHAAILVAAPSELVPEVVERIESSAHTGHAGDGKIFVLDLQDAVRITSGETGMDALL
jgi:nitrogen regulatory protein PII